MSENDMNVVTLLGMLADYHPEWGCGADRIERARDAVAKQRDALRLAEKTISEWLDQVGYRPGECTDDWSPAVRSAVASLVPIRNALSTMAGDA